MSDLVIHRIPVHAAADHIDSLAKVTPVTALVELIWNAFDADATEVRIEVVENRMGGVEEIVVRDNGTGIPLPHAERVFGSLGGSWKRMRQRTGVEHRLLHGREGKGRFRAFALGRIVTWETVFDDVDGRKRYAIRGTRDDLLTFAVETPAPAGPQTPTGTTVRITGIEAALGVLAEDGPAWSQLAEQFALYLKDYPHVRLFFRDDPVSADIAQKHYQEYALADVTTTDGRTHPVRLEVVEWNMRRERKICLCNEAGVTLHQIEAGIRPGEDFNFTAYVRSALIDELQRENRLLLEELDPVVEALVEHARDRLRDHFREKRSQLAARLIRQWKAEGSYPYEEESEGETTDHTSQHLFDRCAVYLHEELTDFRRGDVQTRRVMLNLLHDAVNRSPERIPEWMGELLGLTAEQKTELIAHLPKPGVEGKKTVTADRAPKAPKQTR